MLIARVWPVFLLGTNRCFIGPVTLKSILSFIVYFHLVMTFLLFSGCAEGPTWRMGKLTPWANRQWNQEEQIAESIFTKRQRLSESVDAALAEGEQKQHQVVLELTNIIQNSPIQLMRIEATRQVSRINRSESVAALGVASQDSSADVRLAAARGLGLILQPESAKVLSKMAGSDSNLDVRMAALRSLGNFQQSDVIQALQAALADPNPALQVVAMESLESATGERIGKDVVAWRDYISRATGSMQRTAEAESETQMK